MATQAMRKTGAAVLSVVRLPLWVLALGVAVAYIAIATGDAYVVRVPLKLYLVGAALWIWWWQVGRKRSLLRDYAFGGAVIAFSITIPVVWSVVAGLHATGNDPAGIHQLTWVLQEGSRFVYVLLYFPLVDTRCLLDAKGDNVWLFPVFVLAGITIAFFFTHYLIGRPDETITFLLFKGVFERGQGGFRVFIGNQILFIIAMAVLLARLAVLGPTRIRFAGLALLIVSSYISHTRGIWLGLSVVCAGVLTFMFWADLDAGRRRLLLGVAGGVVGLLALTGIAVLTGVAPRPSFLADASASSRVAQAPKLWGAFLGNPIFGDGIGAVIRPRFVRDPAAPWSYELTYLQLLFQFGLVGTLAVLALPLAAIWRGLKALAGRFQVAPLAGVTGLVGILVASATNPYLLSSFGMLGITVGVSLVGTFSQATRAGSEVLGQGSGIGLNESWPRSSLTMRTEPPSGPG